MSCGARYYRYHHSLPELRQRLRLSVHPQLLERTPSETPRQPAERPTMNADSIRHISPRGRVILESNRADHEQPAEKVLQSRIILVPHDPLPLIPQRTTPAVCQLRELANRTNGHLAAAGDAECVAQPIRHVSRGFHLAGKARERRSEHRATNRRPQ